MITEQDLVETQPAAGAGTVALIVGQLGPAARLLALQGTPELLAAIQALGGQVALVEKRGPDACAAALCGRHIACRADAADLDRALGDERFEAIVAMAPEEWENPVALLQSLASHLQLGGRLIVAWRNPTNLELRLALLHGRLGPDAPDGLPRRLYTLGEMEHLFAETGYAVAWLGRHTMAREHERIRATYPSLSPELLEALARDAEAETVRFVATLQPRQWATPEYLAGHLGETNSRQEAQRSRLAATVTGLRLALDERTDRLQALEAALAQATQRQHALHEQLAMATSTFGPALDQLRLLLDGQAQRLDALAAQVEVASGRTGELRAVLLGAGNGASPLGEMQSTLGPLLAPWQDTLPPAARSDPHRYRFYQQVIHRIRGIVRSVIPDGATVIVISKGDDELLRLAGKQGWHFPQLAHGVYAGFYPADSAAAIAHLEELRAAGGDFLLIPATALWWLEYYVEFRQHLESRYRMVSRQPDTCAIFALHAVEPGA